MKPAVVKPPFEPGVPFYATAVVSGLLLFIAIGVAVIGRDLRKIDETTTRIAHRGPKFVNTASITGDGTPLHPYSVEAPPEVRDLIERELAAAFAAAPDAYINNADRAGELQLLVRMRAIVDVLERVSRKVDPEYRDQVYHSVDGLRAWCTAQEQWLAAHPDPASHRAYEPINLGLQFQEAP
jgi:hypothetical protein